MLLHMPNTDSSMHLLLGAWRLRNLCNILFFLIVSNFTVHFKICDKLKDPKIKVHFNKQLPICQMRGLFITRYLNTVE